MNYEIKRSGGFLGQTKIFKGEIADENAHLLEAIKENKTRSQNSDLRDGYIYSIRIYSESFNEQIIVDETNLNEPLIKLIDIAEKNQNLK